MSEINQNSNEETKSDEHPPANETLQSVEDWSTILTTYGPTNASETQTTSLPLPLSPESNWNSRKLLGQTFDEKPYYPTERQRAVSVPLHCHVEDNRLQIVNRTNSSEQEHYVVPVNPGSLFDTNSDVEIDVVTVESEKEQTVETSETVIGPDPQPPPHLDLTCPETFDQSRVRKGLETEYDSDDSVKIGPPPAKLTRNIQSPDPIKTESDDSKPDNSDKQTTVDDVDDVDQDESDDNKSAQDDSHAVTNAFDEEADSDSNIGPEDED